MVGASAIAGDIVRLEYSSSVVDSRIRRYKPSGVCQSMQFDHCKRVFSEVSKKIL